MRAVVVALLVFYIAGPTARADDAAVKKELQARYAQAARWMASKQIDRFADMLTPDFTAVQPGGQTRNRDQIISDFTNQAMHLKDTTWVRKIEKLSVHGDTAEATVSGKMAGTIMGSGPPAATGTKAQEHKMEFTTLSHDSWVKSKGVWRVKRTELLKAQMTMDGKPVGPPAPRSNAAPRPR